MTNTTTTPKRITKADRERTERENAAAELRSMLKPGDTVNVIQRHVSASGMQRHLSLFVGDQEITFLAATALGEKVAHTYGAAIKVNGCGMDMHFATVYNLSRALWPTGHPCNGNDGPVREGGCPSNDHVNDRERDFSTNRTHSDGGYALRHRTL